MRCSIWRDIKKSSGTMIVDTGCCWCSVPSSLIIRVPSFSHIKRWNRRTPVPISSLSSLSCLFSFSLSVSLLHFSALSSPPPPHSLRYYHFISHIHILSSSTTRYPHCFFSSPSLVSYLTAPFRSPEDASEYFALQLWVFPLLLLRFLPSGYASVFAYCNKTKRKRLSFSFVGMFVRC